MIDVDTIYFHVTKQCNLQCNYCYFNAGNKELEELTTEEIITVINDLPAVNAKRIVFTGGEPLLRDDLFDIVSIANEIRGKIIFGITTNGTLINNSNSHKLVRLFDDIRISIDGPREINDLQRGHCSFDKAIQAFEYIIKAGGNPSAFITATSVNIGHLKGFMKFLVSKGVCKIHISPLKIVGRAHDESLLCNQEDLENVVEEFYFEQFGLSIERRSNDVINCGVGQFISINPDGSVFPCHVLSFPELCIGNVKNEALPSMIENSILMNKLRNLNFNETTKCAACFSELSPQNSCLGFHIRDKHNRNKLLEYL